MLVSPRRCCLAGRRSRCYLLFPLFFVPQFLRSRWTAIDNAFLGHGLSCGAAFPSPREPFTWTSNPSASGPSFGTVRAFIPGCAPLLVFSHFRRSRKYQAHRHHGAWPRLWRPGLCPVPPFRDFPFPQRAAGGPSGCRRRHFSLAIGCSSTPPCRSSLRTAFRPQDPNVRR